MQTAPWTPYEHQRFLDGLERFGAGSTGSEWEFIARSVGSRNIQEVKLHAHQYFLELQASENPAVPSGLLTTLNDSSWRREEDDFFEALLAKYDEGTSGRWQLIADLMPGRSADDVRKRYQKLLFDIGRIEAGEDIAPQYPPVPPARKASKSSAGKATGAKNGAKYHSGPRLSPHEQAVLTAAFEEIRETLGDVASLASTQAVSGAIQAVSKSLPIAANARRPAVTRERALSALDAAYRTAGTRKNNAIATQATLVNSLFNPTPPKSGDSTKATMGRPKTAGSKPRGNSSTASAKASAGNGYRGKGIVKISLPGKGPTAQNGNAKGFTSTLVFSSPARSLDLNENRLTFAASDETSSITDSGTDQIMADARIPDEETDVANGKISEERLPDGA